jgi:hypothetical protein
LLHCQLLPNSELETEIGAAILSKATQASAKAAQIDDGGHIEPALRCPHIGEVSDPFVIGSGRFEAAVEHIGSDGGDLPLEYWLHRA